MAETDYKPISRYTAKERRLGFTSAKLLRDMILKTLEEWDSMVQEELADDQMDPQTIERIKDSILNEVNGKLVWKALAKKDRYDTPFFRVRLEELKRIHPDLKIEKNLHCFVSWPVFNKADIDRTFAVRSDIPAFQWEDQENK
jgi:hypothetical protein